MDQQVSLEVSRSLKGISYTFTGAKFDSDLSFEDWSVFGDQLKSIGRCWQWLLGDWMAFGEKAYGEKYAQAIEVTGLDYQTLATIMWVCSNVEFSLRSEKLSFSHHREVGALPKPDQKKLLEIALSEGLTVKELHKLVMKKKDKNSGNEVQQSAPVVALDVVLGFRNAIVAAANITHPSKWDNKALANVRDTFYGVITEVEKLYGWNRDQFKKSVEKKAKAIRKRI